MKSYAYGEKRDFPTGFSEFWDRHRSAVISIDMQDCHLVDSPECPCPAPRAREIVVSIDSFHDRARSVDVPVIHVRTVLRRGGVNDVNGGKSAWRLVFPL